MKNKTINITYVEYFPLLRRLMHWLLVLAVTADVISGLFLNLAPDYVAIRNWRLIHGFASWSLVSMFILYTYVFLVTGWWRDLVPTLEDGRHALRFLKYVFYLQYRYKQKDRYNPGQKLVYLSWVAIFLLMILTGVGLFFGIELKPFGTWEIGLQSLRWVHYLGNTYLLVTLPLHVYLALAEDPARLAGMFCGVIRNKVGSR